MSAHPEHELTQERTYIARGLYASNSRYDIIIQYLVGCCTRKVLMSLGWLRHSLYTKTVISRMSAHPTPNPL